MGQRVEKNETGRKVREKTTLPSLNPDSSLDFPVL